MNKIFPNMAAAMPIKRAPSASAHGSDPKRFERSLADASRPAGDQIAPPMKESPRQATGEKTGRNVDKPDKKQDSTASADAKPAREGQADAPAADRASAEQSQTRGADRPPMDSAAEASSVHVPVASHKANDEATEAAVEDAEVQTDAGISGHALVKMLLADGSAWQSAVGAMNDALTPKPLAEGMPAMSDVKLMWSGGPGTSQGQMMMTQSMVGQAVDGVMLPTGAGLGQSGMAGDESTSQGAFDGQAGGQQTSAGKLVAALFAQGMAGKAAVAAGGESTAQVTPAGDGGSVARLNVPTQASTLATPQPTGQADADGDVNAARLARGLHSALQQRGGAITLRLTPPEMGTVRIEVQIRSGVVSAQFHAETAAAKSMLQGQLAQLRQSLESQGLSVERLGAQTMSSSTSPGAQQSQGGQQGNSQDEAAHDGRSRGQYSQGGGDRRDQRGREQSDPSTFEQALGASE